MTKIALLTVFAALSVMTTRGQDFPGYRSGSYAGVNGVFFNPAYAAGNGYRFDINLFSISAVAANDQATYKLSRFSKTFNSDSLRNQVFGRNAGPATGFFSADVLGPSVMFGLGRRTAVAVTTRARVFANATDIDGKLFNQVTEEFPNDPSLPYTIASSRNMRFSVNAWSELGVNFARVVSEGEHFVKAGATIKYLAGAGSGYINIDNFNGTIDSDLILQDVFLRSTTGRIATGFSGLRISGFEAGDLFQKESSGLGADLGVIYEYRPAGAPAIDRSGSNYRFRLSASLLDLGSIRYEKDIARSGTYDIGITGNERLSFRQLRELDLDDYNAFFASRPQFFTPDADNAATGYRVSLPTTLHLGVDYHFQAGWYVNFSSQLALTNNDSKGYNNRSYSSFALVPRYEGRIFGLYVPVSYSELVKLNAGLSIRVGPVFAGSGSLFTALFGESKQADAHFGIRFGGRK